MTARCVRDSSISACLRRCSTFGWRATTGAAGYRVTWAPRWRTTGAVRFRTGLLVGLAVGYYYGSKAGRERHEQIDRYLAQMRETDTYRVLRGRVGGMVDESITRSRGLLEDTVFGGASPSPVEGAGPYDHTGDPTLN
jgi:hypothetical protein